MLVRSSYEGSLDWTTMRPFTNGKAITFSRLDICKWIGIFPGGAVVKSLPANAGDTEDIFHPGLGKILWRWKWQPVLYSCVENSMDRGAWRAMVHEVAKSQTTTKWPSACKHVCVCARAHTHTHTHTQVPDRNREVWPTAGASLREVSWGLWDLPLAPPDSLSILLSLGGWPTWIIRGTALLLAFYCVWSVREHPQKMRKGRRMQFWCLSSGTLPEESLPTKAWTPTRQQFTQPSLSKGEELLPTLAFSGLEEVRSPTAPALGICIIPCESPSSCLHLCTVF